MPKTEMLKLYIVREIKNKKIDVYHYLLDFYYVLNKQTYIEHTSIEYVLRTMYIGIVTIKVRRSFSALKAE